MNSVGLVGAGAGGGVLAGGDPGEGGANVNGGKGDAGFSLSGMARAASEKYEVTETGGQMETR